MSKKVLNLLLQKSGLGKTKEGVHELPNEQHVYGKAPIKDKYGAREVVSGWLQHTVSQINQPDKNFVAMNKEGIKKGCIDSRQITKFRKDNEIKIKVKEGQKYYRVSIPNEDFVYGISNRPSTPIKNVICNTYAMQELQLKRQREAVLSMLHKDKKQLPKVQGKIIQKQSPKKQAVGDNNFKLAKFKHVQSKIKPFMTSDKNKKQ